MDAKTQQIILDKIVEENKKSAAEQALKAKYKIQIWFRSDRSMRKPIAFSLSFWESGMRLHGGGDEMMFICRRNEGCPDIRKEDLAPGVHYKDQPGKRGCNKLIPGEWSGGMIICPHCGTKHVAEQVGDSIFFRTSIDNAAKILEHWWRKLDGNADIYAKYTPTDPRTVLMANAHGIKKARERKGLTIYPLKNILTDTANGSSVASRFKAFIMA